MDNNITMEDVNKLYEGGIITKKEYDFLLSLFAYLSKWDDAFKTL